jgi:hypothetical protein
MTSSKMCNSFLLHYVPCIWNTAHVGTCARARSRSHLHDATDVRRSGGEDFVHNLFVKGSKRVTRLSQ